MRKVPNGFKNNNKNTHKQHRHTPILPRQSIPTPPLRQRPHDIKQRNEPRCLHQRPSDTARDVEPRHHARLAHRIVVDEKLIEGKLVFWDTLVRGEGRESGGGGVGDWGKKTPVGGEGGEEEEWRGNELSGRISRGGGRDRRLCARGKPFPPFSRMFAVSKPSFFFPSLVLFPKRSKNPSIQST